MSTYTPIASQTLTSAASSVTFSNIPQTYTDLVLVSNIIGSGVGYPTIRFNNDTGTNYSFTQLYGTGTTAGTDKAPNYSSIVIPWISRYTTSAGYMDVVNIMNYSNTTTNKTVIGRANNAGYGTDSSVGLWRNTSAITTITLTALSANFASGSIFNLYGIATSGINTVKAIGGDSVVSDGTYWYHTFTTSGTFTTEQSINADILTIAGGGSGGSRAGGGGGAGGLVYLSSQSLTENSYNVTVGAGGPAVFSVPSNRGNNGSNSQFGSLTAAVGGGAGGVYPGTTGLTATVGGSGGGGGSILGSTSGAGAAGTAGQGNAGGNGASGAYHGGGGGGAGGSGSNGNNSVGGNGGVGSSSYSSWGLATATGQEVTGTRYYAGGGGGSIGGSGGSGGGGAGASGGVSNATAGLTNTGGGGGGARNDTDTTNVYSGAGGSGIVIVRYAV